MIMEYHPNHANYSIDNTSSVEQCMMDSISFVLTLYVLNFSEGT